MSHQTGFILADGTHVQPQVPFFIAGSGRCGTTLMRRLLIEHAHAIIPPENYVLSVSPHLLTMARGDWGLFCRLVLTNLMKYAADWADYGIDAGAALPLLVALPPEHRNVADFWHAFHALYARHVGRPGDTRWGDKTPSSVDALPELIGIFPSARFIFMVRDVFDMAFSYGSMAAPGRTGDYLGGARRWVDANTKLISFCNSNINQTMIMRYEDLVRDTAGAIALTLAHLGASQYAAGALSAAEARDMAVQPDLRNVLRDVHIGSVGKGRSELADGMKDAITAIAAPLQIRLGYEPLR